MGKTKNRRYRKQNNPTGLPSVKSVELEDDERGPGFKLTPNKHEKVIQSILDQLDTHGIDAKMCGLNTLSSMTEDESFVESALQHNIVKIVGPLLVDPFPPVREAASMALRNISGMGIPEVCDVLVAEDVLTYIFALFEKFYSSNWLPCHGNGEASAMEQDETKKTKKKKSKMDKKLLIAEPEEACVNTFIQGVHMLWNLCKSNDLAVKVFTQGNILPYLSCCLDPKEYGIDAAVAVAHCLHTVTENNEVTSYELRQTSEEVLLKILSPAFEGEVTNSEKPSQYLLLRVLAAGIVLNISKRSTGISPVLNMRLAMAIKDAIAEDHWKAISVIPVEVEENRTEHPDNSQDDGESNEAMDVDDLPAELIENATSLIMAQTIAIELLTNIYYKEDEADDWVDSECEDIPEGDMECNGSAISCGVPEVEEVFWDKDNVENILKKVEKDDVIWEKLRTNSETKDLMEIVSILRCRSLLCLQNVLSSVQDDHLKGFPGAFSVWEKLTNLVWEEGIGDFNLLEAATGAMRAMSERIFKMDPKSFAATIRKPGLQRLLDVDAKCSDYMTRINIIRTVGTMGEALVHSSSEESCELIGFVGSFLLQVSSKMEENLLVVAEALDALMDVFAEDSTDKAAVQIGLVKSLKSLLPSLRSKLRQQRKSLGHHGAVVATANSNLERFIEYKANHISPLSMST